MVDKNAIDKMVARFLDTFYWTREQTAGWVRSNFVERLRYENEVVKQTPNLTAKTTPIDADSAVIVDSAASNVLRRVTFTNIKAFLKTYFDTLYGLLGSTNSWTGVNTFTADVIAGVVRRANETGDLLLMGGTSTTQGPYIWLVGKDAGGSVDGAISYVSSTESSALGDHIFYVHNGTSDVEILRLTAAGDLVLPDAGLNYVRLNNTTGTIAMVAAPSTTDGPYVAVVGKDQGGSEDGTVQFSSTTESGALGDHIWFVYNGTNFGEIMRLTAAGLLTVQGSMQSLGYVYANQNSTTGNTAPLHLNQADTDQPLFEIDATSSAGFTTINTGAVGAYAGRVLVDINGTLYWMPFYN